MQPNKVYESLAHLANNIVKNEKLRFELFDKPLFKDQFVKQINNMLALEKDFNQELNGEKWATIFAKAVVKIIGKKQRFEKPEGRSIEEIYADYSAFIAYTISSFQIGRNELVDDTIRFTEQDILFSAVLTEEIKDRYKGLENEKIQAEKSAEEQKNQQPNQNQQNNNFSQEQPNNTYFGGAGFGNPQQGFMNMPVHPMQDPRFYPYNAKPKWMPIMKYMLAIIALIGSIMLIVGAAVMMATTFNFENSDYGNALFGTGGDKIPWTGDWDAFLDKKNSGLNSFPLSFALMQGNWVSIIGYFLYSIPSIYIAYYAFRKPRTLGEKYHLNFVPVIFMIILFVSSLFTIFNFVNANQIKLTFAKTFSVLLTDPSNVGEGFAYQFNSFWDVVLNNYGKEINSLTAVIDTAIGIIAAAVVLGIILMIINPKLDREKVMEANMEFQKATMAAMQGQSYQINPALYENSEEIINRQPSKFSLWWQKIFKKRKSKNNQDKSKDK